MTAVSGDLLTARSATIDDLVVRLREKGILDHFIAGGSPTAGGILHAVTSAAQVHDDGDAAWDLETSALEALRLATAL